MSVLKYQLQLCDKSGNVLFTLDYWSGDEKIMKELTKQLREGEIHFSLVRVSEVYEEIL